MADWIKYFLIMFLVVGSVWVFSSGSGEGYDSVVVFRNDDVSNLDDDFREFNSVFTGESIPVTHSVIPENIEGSSEFNSTCNSLRNLEGNNTYFAIHGYNHDGFEFKNSDWNEIDSKITRIESFSNNCLNRRPGVFVAPQNAMSSSARILLNESGFNVISADRKMAWQTGSVTVRENRTEFLNERPLELGQSSMMVERWDTDPVEFKNLSEVKAGFDNSVENNEIHVQTVHYKALMRNNQSEKLESLIDHMRDENVYFTSFAELGELFEEDKIRFNGDEWIIRKNV